MSLLGDHHGRLNLLQHDIKATLDEASRANDRAAALEATMNEIFRLSIADGRLKPLQLAEHLERINELALRVIDDKE